ncbi:putative family 17 glucosidase [Clavispora lusitaniae]|uniref:Family 17 glucosidase n=1 Tax=Clavispora lusitaniae TaxID=36911 RepID=A0AA91Q0R6_CLALS|nr:putative family 17 glucosidase [Clavispora lusitaniae]
MPGFSNIRRHLAEVGTQHAMRIYLFLVLAAALPVREAPLEARAVGATTTNIGWAQLLGLAPTGTPAPTTTSTAQVAPTPTTTRGTGIFGSSNTGNSGSGNSGSGNTGGNNANTGSSGSNWLSSLLSLFSPSSSSNTSPSSTASPSSSSASPSGSGFFASLLELLGGSRGNGASGSSGATQATASSATSTSGGSGLFNTASESQSGDKPAFSGLVVVEGAGGSDTGSESTQTDAPSSEGAEYAEQGVGITYSPYTKSGQCKSASQVASDMAKLRSYQLIRLYSVDCSGIQNVIRALGSQQQLFLGVWAIDNLDTDLSSMAQQVESGSRGWRAVHTVAIGNEVVNSGRGSASQVRAAVQKARQWFSSNAPSYSGAIVSVDTLAAVMADSSMCDISDYLAVNCHPYFSGIEASTSGTWLQQQTAQLKSHCNNGKDILITESGWPNAGNTLGQAVPSTENQVLALQSLGKVMGHQVVMFTMYNDYWKDPGPYNVEQRWGIYGDPSA